MLNAVQVCQVQFILVT